MLHLKCKQAFLQRNITVYNTFYEKQLKQRYSIDFYSTNIIMKKLVWDIKVDWNPSTVMCRLWGVFWRALWGRVTTEAPSSALGLSASRLTQPHVWFSAVTAFLLITHLTLQCLSLQRTGPEQKHRKYIHPERTRLFCVWSFTLYDYKINISSFQKNEKQTGTNKEKK